MRSGAARLLQRGTTRTLERMSRTPLIPPHEAPPVAWERADRFNWKLALLGAAAGVLVGIIAFLLAAPPWWWFAIAVGLAVGFINSKSFRAPVLWGRK